MGDLAYGREGVEEGDIWGQLVSEYAKKIEYRERARRLFYVIQYRILFSAGDHSLLQDFKHELKNLEVMLGEYDLAQVGYYYYHVAMIYLAELGEHELAESKCDSLIDLLKSRPAISMPRRFGSTHIHMAKFQIQQSKFTDAIRSGKVAAIHCAMSSNLGECYVVQCYAHIYRGDYQLAIKAARKALELTAEKDEPIRFAERTYLKACAYFLMGEHYHAHVGLQKETKELDKDKQGYKVAISILNIMNQIAWRGAMTNADNYIDALRKRVQRNRDRFTLSARFMTIIEILKALQLHGYDFGVVSKTHAVEIKSLQSQEKGEAWYFLAPEVVRFDLWFSSMAERRPYKLVV
jgi:tetratricopeptide (TPR) repeat protein